MICPKCRHKNTEGSSYCSACGTKLETSYICSNCGNSIRGNETFCTVCGAKNSAVHPGTGRPKAGKAAPTRIYNPLNSDLHDPEVSPQLSYDDHEVSAPKSRRGPIIPPQSSPDPYGSFKGDRYADDSYAYDDVDDYAEYDNYDDYDEYDDYDDYPERRRPNAAKTILIVVLAIVALVVVIGIISIISGFVNDSRERIESTTTASTEMVTTPPTTTTQPILTTATTLPTTTPLTFESSTTLPSETTTVPTTTAPIEAGKSLIVLNERGFVIRSGPGTSNSSLGIAGAGTTLKIIGEVQGEMAEGYGSTWYQIEYNGQTAYVIKDTRGGQQVR